jgi:hypothetical protein
MRVLIQRPAGNASRCSARLGRLQRITVRALWTPTEIIVFWGFRCKETQTARAIALPIVPAAAVTKRVFAIVTSLHFAFANVPRPYRGQVAAKLANCLSPPMAPKRLD